MTHIKQTLLKRRKTKAEKALLFIFLTALEVIKANFVKFFFYMSSAAFKLIKKKMAKFPLL